MKWFALLLGSLSAFFLFAQTEKQTPPIGLSRFKTVSLVFPSQVLSIDRGSEQVLVQKVAAHILKVKAAVDSFPASNLTVITADGKLYSLEVIFSDHPSKLVWYFGDSSSVKNIHPLAAICATVMKLRSVTPNVKYSTGKMSLQWMGWFVRDNQLFCKLKCINRSSIGYDVEQFQWYIRDNVVSRRTTSQELVQQPLYVAGDTGTIKAGSSRIWIIALEKFTIPDDKHFAVEVLEKNGGRHLYLRSNNRQLMRAKEF